MPKRGEDRVIGQAHIPYRTIYSMARAIPSFNRAMPKLIPTMAFVLMSGVEPVAGIFVLGVHVSGFLGTYLVDDIENTAPGLGQRSPSPAWLA